MPDQTMSHPAVPCRFVGQFVGEFVGQPVGCQFVPPYLLRRLVELEGVPVRGSTLALDDRLRERRETPPATAAPAGGGRRQIHTAANTEQLPGELVRGDDDPATGDPAVNEAWQSSGESWDLFAEEFGRESFDGTGSTVVVTVHYGSNYDNAFWDGQQLVFGDGDGEIFERFTKPMDVLAHEFTHGVVQFTTGFTYRDQPGALNESVADVFASMAKQRVLSQTVDQADWLIGEGLFRPGVNAKALRSMLQPGSAYDDERLGRDPQVGSMADYVDTTDDNGGVHINSGIPNRAFALVAVELGGRSWERAGRVWYDTLVNGGLGAGADFAAFADATVAAAGRLFADDAAVVSAVRQAWTTVGVMSASSSAVSDRPSSPNPRPAGPAPSAPARVAVRRSGGFAGAVRAAEVDLDADPEGPELRTLLSGLDLGRVRASESMPDRFVYTVEYGEISVTLPEQDLTPDLSRVVELVLRPRGSQLG